MRKRILYEVHVVLPEKEEPISFAFDTYEAADLWLSDFDEGGISEIVIDDKQEEDYEKMLRAFEAYERELGDGSSDCGQM